MQDLDTWWQTQRAACSRASAWPHLMIHHAFLSIDGLSYALVKLNMSRPACRSSQAFPVFCQAQKLTLSANACDHTAISNCSAHVSMLEAEGTAAAHAHLLHEQGKQGGCMRVTGPEPTTVIQLGSQAAPSSRPLCYVLLCIQLLHCSARLLTPKAKEPIDALLLLN